MTRIRLDHISGLFWLLFGGYVIYESRLYGLGSLTDPGPGFLLFNSGIGLAGLSCLVLIKEIIKPDTESLPILWEGVPWWKPGLCFLSLLIYTVVVSHLGFVLTTFLLLVYLFTIGRNERKIMALPIALGTVVIAYLVFDILLQCQLPRGALWR
jgi:putative tricarboxylic transport membrane protein